MPETVIARVNLLGKGQPEQLTFLDRKGRPIGDTELTGVGDGVEPQNQIEAIQDDDDDSTVLSNDLDPIGDPVYDPVDDQVIDPVDAEVETEPDGPLLEPTVAPTQAQVVPRQLPVNRSVKIEPAAIDNAAVAAPDQIPVEIGSLPLKSLHSRCDISNVIPLLTCTQARITAHPALLSTQLVLDTVMLLCR